MRPPLEAFESKHTIEENYEQNFFLQSCEDFSLKGKYGPLQQIIQEKGSFEARRNDLFTEAYSYPENSEEFQQTFAAYEYATRLLIDYKAAMQYLHNHPTQKDSFPHRPLLDQYLTTEHLEQQFTVKQGTTKRKSKIVTLLGKEQQEGYQRSKRARQLEKNSNGKIVLRPDGKIDFPELGIKGAARLNVEGPTDFENGLVQGDYADQHGNQGVPGLTYMTKERAKKEAKKQGLKLFPTDEAEQKTKALLNILGSAGIPTHEACQILFGKDLSGFWRPLDKRWDFVGSVSYLGLSEVDSNGYVRSIKFFASGTNRLWNLQTYPQPFLAFEDC